MKHFFYVLLFAGCCSSCKKYLDEKPNSALLIPGNVEEVQALLDKSSEFNSKSTSQDIGSADEYYITQSVYDSRSIGDQEYYTWSRYDYSRPANDYSFVYDVVLLSNICLKAMETVSRTQVNSVAYDNAKGSALLFRGNAFMRGVWLFAKAYDASTADRDLGIVLRLDPDINSVSVRSSVTETYNQVISDLRASVPLLPLISQHPQRPSKVAAYGLLSRVYLSMRNYDSALYFSDLALQNVSTLMDYNDPNDVLPGEFFPFTSKFNREVIFSTRIVVYTSLNALPQENIIDSTLYASYSNDDLRKETFFLDFGLGLNFKGSYDGEFSNQFTGLAVDELMLTRAECRARKGDRTGALDDLNTLLIKRWRTGTFVPYTAATDIEALDIILLERKKELIFRGLRWIDIKRLNKEGANIVLKRNINNRMYTLEPNANYYALALPSDIINMTGIPQNDR